MPDAIGQSAFEVKGRDIYLAESARGLALLQCSTTGIATHLCAVLNGASLIAREFIVDEHEAHEAAWSPPVRTQLA